MCKDLTKCGTQAMVRDNEVRRVQQNQPETSEELSMEGIACRRRGLWVPHQESWRVDVYWQKAPRSDLRVTVQ